MGLLRCTLPNFSPKGVFTSTEEDTVSTLKIKVEAQGQHLGEYLWTIVQLGTVQTFGLVITDLSLGTELCACHHNQEKDSLINSSINSALIEEVISGIGKSICSFQICYCSASRVEWMQISKLIFVPGIPNMRCTVTRDAFVLLAPAQL